MTTSMAKLNRSSPSPATSGAAWAAVRGNRSLRANYLVGCDGGRSLVRKAAGIEFPGWDSTTSSLLAQVEMTEEPELGIRRTPSGMHALGKVEYEIKDGEVVYKPGGTVGVMLTESKVGTSEPTLRDLSEGLIAVYGTDYGIHSPTWISRFTDMTRQAAAYREGRVLLAGDAAHVHSPVGGQGLNTGVQDAVNLGWKLAQVVNQTSPESLLDSYHAERHPVAARVLRNTMAQTALMRANDRIEALRDTVSELLGMDEPRKRFAARIVLFFLTGCQSVEKEDAANFFLKGNVQFQQKNYEQALHYYEESLAKNSDFSDAYLNKGLVLLALQRPVDALQSFTLAIEADEQLYPAYLARAEVSARLGQWNEALSDLNTIQKFYADSSQYFLIHGNVLVGKNDQSAALADFDRALQLQPDNTEARVNRGAVYFDQKLYNPAKADFEAALKTDPIQPEALNNLGLLAARNKQWSTALAYLDRALSVNPVDPLALNNKGFVLLNTGNLEDAVSLINRSIQNRPDNGYALRNLGLYYFKKNELEKSLENFNKALELAQPVELLHGYAGEAYLKTGNKKKACEIWKIGVVLKDSLAEANYNVLCR